MQVNSLIINNLRNLESVKIEPDPGLNVFIGENGAGKTSILEALAVLSKGRSFRAGQTASLIGPKQAHFQVIGKIESQAGAHHQVGMQRSVDEWSARHNGEDVAQLSQLTELLPYVLLEPSSHTLVSGPPDGRRKFLDWGVFHVKHSFLALWRRYNRTLKQRNAALRQSNQLMVESLDPQLITLGEELHKARELHATQLARVLKEKLPRFNETLIRAEISYRKGWAGDRLEKALSQAFQSDMDRGATGPGPHKADIVITIDGRPAREVLSRGEQKAMTAALIITQAKMICESGDKPVLLLDDLSSELDAEHHARVLQEGLELGVQIWLTGTKTTASIKAINSDFAMFHVKHGVVTRAKNIRA